MVTNKIKNLEKSGKKSWRSILRQTWICILLNMLPWSVWATRVHLAFGGFHAHAEVSGLGEFSMTRLGCYYLGADWNLNRHITAQVGYSVIFSETIGGDMGFGPDLRLLYYPFGRVDRISFGHDYLVGDLWQTQGWFLSTGFHQKQFQSTESTYAGFSFGTGYELLVQKGLGAFVRADYYPLRGPSLIQLTYAEFLFGMSFFLGQD